MKQFAARASALAAACVVVDALEPRKLLAADLSAGYEWNPVRIGAGGLVTGIEVHPLDGDVRYARTDVGNTYRWDESARDGAGEWLPMIVARSDGTGMPASTTTSPAWGGVESIAIDPSNTDVVYMSLPLKRPNLQVAGPIDEGGIYKSIDGGVSFSRLELTTEMQPNSRYYRNSGERMAVDPNTPDTLYYGTREDGLQKSIDGGMSWQTITGTNGPAADANVLNVHLFGTGVSSVLYVVALADADDGAFSTGKVLRSLDGGATWDNLSLLGGPATQPSEAALGDDGTLWVSEYGTRKVHRFRDDAWLSADAKTPSNVEGIAVDPTDATGNTVFALASNGGLSRSTDGGASWSQIASRTNYAPSDIGWLPQPVQPEWHGTTGIEFGPDGVLYMTQGNEGVLQWDPVASASVANPPQWTIISHGIEELVTHDVKLLPGSGDRAITTVHDATGFVIDDPDTFSAEWIGQHAWPDSQGNLKDQLIVNATGIAYSPDNPDYVVIQSGDPNYTSTGGNFSSYSTDGGDSWNYFGERDRKFQGGYPALGRSDGGTFAETPIVIMPQGSLPPQYSHDGGQTWTAANGFPVYTQADADADPNDDITDKRVGNLKGMSAFWGLSLKQHPLVADPLVSDRFYARFTFGGVWRSDDAGVNWERVEPDGPVLPYGAFHSQLHASRMRADGGDGTALSPDGKQVGSDLWFVSGWEGTYGAGESASNGLWTSVDGAETWTKLPNVQYAHALDLGKGSGIAGDAEYSVYVFGLVDGETEWGTFRSDDLGQTWNRISFYPTGIFDQVTTIGASWDTHGLLYVGFGGNSFVYGQPTEVAGSFLQDDDGLLSIEAEHYSNKVDRAGDAWEVINDSNASNGTAVAALDNDGDFFNTNFVGNSPELQYDVKFTKSGTHYVWVRARGATPSDDSLHIGIDGQAVDTSDRISLPIGSGWSWSRATMDGPVATLNTSLATSQLNVWMREDGAELDKIVLTTDPGYLPSGTGPAESLRTSDGVIDEPLIAVYEAEEGTISNGAVQGIFVDYWGTGAYVEWDDVHGGISGGPATFEFQYANGSSASRTSKLYVNGIFAENVDFAPTGSWSAYAIDVVNATLQAGLNTVRLVADPSTGPNLDWLRVTRPDAAPPSAGFVTNRVMASLFSDKELVDDELSIGRHLA